MTENRRSLIVTGATGFIGSHLVERLVESDFSVIAVTRSICQLNTENVTWCEWDKLEELLLSIEVPEAVIHLATHYGRDGGNTVEVESANVVMPLKLIELAIKFGIKRFINTDSYFAKAEFNYQYMRPYIISKNSFLQWGGYFSSKFGLTFINMRLEHVYGERDSSGKFIPFVIDSLINNKEYLELTDCTQKRDFIHVADVVSAFITVLNSENIPSFAEYQVGLGFSVELMLLVELIKKEIPYAKTRIIYGAHPQRENEIFDSFANNSSLIALGWHPSLSIFDGICRTVTDAL